MEPLRQGRTQKTLIWEEKDFSSKLWEITTLLRMTYFLQERGYKFWFSLNVLRRALVTTCSVSATWRGKPGSRPGRGSRSDAGTERGGADMEARPTALPLQAGSQDAAASQPRRGLLLA